MKLMALFFARLSVLLTKWAAIGVLWLASVFLVTSSALLMDQISDWARMLGSYTTPYAKQKATAKTANKRALKAEKTVAKQKKLAKVHSTKVKKIGGKMVARNVADASTSMIPVIGGAASVTFAVWDVYAACELIAAQKEFELLIGTATDDEYTTLEAACVTTTATVEATSREAKQYIDKMSDLTDLPELDLPEWDFPDWDFPHEPTHWPGAPDLPHWLADQACKLTGNC